MAEASNPKRKGTSEGGGTYDVISLGSLDPSSPAAKQAKLESTLLTSEVGGAQLMDLSTEVLVRILENLPASDMLRLEHLHSKLTAAVEIALRSVREVDVTSGKWSSEVSVLLDDDRFKRLMVRCENARHVFGLHPRDTRQAKDADKYNLTSDGVLAGLAGCSKLELISTSSLPVLDFVLNNRPAVQIKGHFRNRHSSFPAPEKNRLRIPANALLTQISLVGVHVPCLPDLPGIAELNLKWIVFSETNPFKSFSAPNLQLFSMKHCHCITSDATKAYGSLFEVLSSAPFLSRMDIARIPFPSGCVQQVAEAKMQERSFQRLANFSVSACHYAAPIDMFFPIIMSRHSLERLHLQPSLSSDVFFMHTQTANLPFQRFSVLDLGYRDDFPTAKEDMTEEKLSEHGLEPYTVTECPLTDMGMQLALTSFKQMKILQVYKAPKLVGADYWLKDGDECGKFLREITLTECGQIASASLGAFLSRLPALETLKLSQVGSSLSDMVEKGMGKTKPPPLATQAVIQALSLLDVEGEKFSGDEAGRLPLTSKTLRNVSVIECPFIGLDVKNCPEMETITVMNCPSLKSIVFEETPIARCKIVDCPKLTPSGFLPSLARLSPNGSHLVVYNCLPESIDKEEIELLAFSLADDYHVGVIYDKVCPLSVRTDLRMTTWMEIIDDINGQLLKDGFPKAVFPLELPKTASSEETQAAESTADGAEKKSDESGSAVAAEAPKEEKKKVATKKRGKAGGTGGKKKKSKRVELPCESTMEMRYGREVWHYKGIAKIDGELGDFVYVGDIPWMKELAETTVLRHWREAGVFAPTVPPIPVLRPEFTAKDCIDKLKNDIEKRKQAGRGVLSRCLTVVVCPAKVEEQIF
eukprot:m.1895 g.1895  ORF g.1895 m.1895 type:complete len:869 (+) comp8014_c0_seq1:161-2767(+)